MNKTELGVRIIDGCILLLLLGVIAWTQASDEEARKAEEQSYAALLATCMNGEALIDRNTDTAYFCGKPTEIKL